MENNDRMNQLEKYKTSLATIQQQFPSVLDDFKKYYVLSNKEPDSNEYKQLYLSIKGNMEELFSQLFFITNNAQKDIDELNKSLLDLNSQIDEEKKKNNKYKSEVNNLQGNTNGSHKLSTNYSTLYTKQCVRNNIMFFGVILISLGLFNIFKNKQ